MSYLSGAERQMFAHFRHEHKDIQLSREQEHRLLNAARRTGNIMISVFSSGDKEVKGDLLKSRAGEFAKYQMVPSPPHICVATLMDLVEQIVVQGRLIPLLEKIKGTPSYLSPKEDIVEAVSWIDIMEGATMTLGSIYVAERELEGVSDQAIAATAALITKNEGEAAQLYIRTQPELQAFSTEVAQLMFGEEGRTGLPLLEDQVQRLVRAKSSEGQIAPRPYRPFQIVSMLLAGAQMARDSYKVLYPVAEQLPPFTS